MADIMTVTGIGYDVHRLEAGDGMHLCGVHIPCPLALVGHSDADAGLHAITDALLGAAGLVISAIIFRPAITSGRAQTAPSSYATPR